MDQIDVLFDQQDSDAFAAEPLEQGGELVDDDRREAFARLVEDEKISGSR